MTVFLTTQYLEEADRLADRIAVIDGGRVVAEGTAAQLKRMIAGPRVDLTLAGPGAFAETAELLGERVTTRDAGALVLGVPTDGSAARRARAARRGRSRRRPVASFAIHDATLDDVFLALTGHTTPEETAMSDALTLSGRCLRLSRRNTEALLTSLMLPIMLMLLFVYLFGGAIDRHAST